MRLRARQRRTVALLIVAAIAAGAGVLAYYTHLLRRTEQQTIDARFSIRGARKPSSGLVLVLIDNATLQALSRAGLAFRVPIPAPLRREGDRRAASRRAHARSRSISSSATKPTFATTTR